MINLEWYKTFIAIYEFGTLTEASHNVHMTQPGVGMHLASLEAAIGKKLFIRTKKKLLPTQEGKQLYTQIVESMGHLNKISQQYNKYNNIETSTVKIGAPLEYFSEFIIDKLSTTQSHIWTEFELTDPLLRKLEEGKLDLVIATKKNPIKSLEFTPLIEENFILVGSKKHDMPSFVSYPQKARLNAIEKWLKDQKWISYDTDLPIIRRFWQQNFNKRPNIRPALVIPNLHLVKKSVALGQGISILPEYLCREELKKKSLKKLWTDQQSVTNTLYSVIKNSDRHVPHITYLQKQFLKLS